MAKIKKISASSLATFLACPLKYKFAQEVEAAMDSPHLIYGTALHKAIEEMHKGIFYGELLTKRRLQEIFYHNWQLGIELNEIPVKWWKWSQEREMTDAGVRSVDNYYEVHKNDKPPPVYLDFSNKEVPAIEIGFRVPLKPLIPDTDYMLSGIIDRINHQDELIVEDHKTGSSKYSEFQVATNLQLAIYSFAFRQLVNQKKFPEYKKNTKEDWVMFDIISKKRPEIFYHRRKINDATYKHLGHIIKTMISQIERNEFLPNYGAECDSYGGCGHRQRCQAFKFKEV
jgi:hypothetical protein